MFYRIATLSLLAIASTLSLTSIVQAETVNVPFSGTLAGQCSFTNISPGTITFTDSQTFNTAAGDSGSVTVTCNKASATLQITDVSYSTGPTNTGYTLSASAVTPPATATYTNGTSDGQEVIGVGVYTATVSMSGTNSAIMTAGDYEFNVTLEALPN